MMSCCDTGTKLLACDWFAKHLLRQARISPESERLIRTGTEDDVGGTTRAASDVSPTERKWSGGVPPEAGRGRERSEPDKAPRRHGSVVVEPHPMSSQSLDQERACSIETRGVSGRPSAQDPA